MSHSNPLLDWISHRKPEYQQAQSEHPAPEPAFRQPDTPLAPAWPSSPVCERLYTENQMFIDQARAACEDAARRGY